MKPLTVRSATLLGFLAMVFWSTTVAVCRSLIEKLGPFSYLALTSGGGGLMLYAISAIRRRDWRAPLRLSRSYLMRAGPCFVLYFSLFSLAHHLASSRTVSIQLGLVNYLWPALILLFSVPILGRKARWPLLLVGLALGTAGIGLAVLEDLSFAALLQNMAQNKAAFAVMFIAAICWGLYSNLTTKYHDPEAPGAVPVFQLVTAALGLALWLVQGESVPWEQVPPWELAYTVVFPTALGYVLWETGMRQGDQTLLGACSYLIPLASTAFAWWYLDVAPTWTVGGGCMLVIAGAVLSKKGIQRHQDAEALRD